jgi:transposase InsO family protein
MNDERLQTLEQVRNFIEGSQEIDFRGLSPREKYRWIEEVLKRFRYLKLKKEGKGLLKSYLLKVTGYSRAQLTRLIGLYQQSGEIQPAEYQRYRFPQRYSAADVALLAATDELHGWLSGPATKKILERESEVYGHQEYATIAGISVAQIYNLRRSQRYGGKRYTHTNPVVSKIGERVKPESHGQPGHIRIDTVHQGDMEGRKGVYHINAVDEVTQWEVVTSVARISENHLAANLENILNQFPFHIKGFHSDNGGEFVNKVVAEILNKLLIRFTKSRPRHPDDNGLVESKNGSVIRKNLGYVYIPQAGACLLNGYHQRYLNPYINFHRPCFFPVEEIDRKGRVKKKYPYDRINTPFEKLKVIPDLENYLRTGVTLEKLQFYADQVSDNTFAERMVKARSKLLQQTQSLTYSEADRLRTGSFFD